jgi:hypothetical protein
MLTGAGWVIWLVFLEFSPSGIPIHNLSLHHLRLFMFSYCLSFDDFFKHGQNLFNERKVSLERLLKAIGMG